MRTTMTIMLALGLGGLGCARTPERATVPQETTSNSGSEARPPFDSRPVRPTPGPDSGRSRSLSEDGEAAASPDAEALASAFAERLTVWRRHDGTRVLTPHCRNGPVPCEERLLAFAALIVEIAGVHDIDPLLVAAMAVRESGLDPSALGRRREAGIIQLHPRGAGHDVRYVQDAAYRARCQSRVDACQREVLERGISTLVRGMEQCGGVRGALGAYASGQCTTSIRYIDRVLEERARLQRLVRQVRPSASPGLAGVSAP